MVEVAWSAGYLTDLKQSRIWAASPPAARTWAAHSAGLVRAVLVS